VLAALLGAAGVLVCDRYMQRFGRADDPSEIVLDEVAGQWLTVAFLGLGVAPYLLGFVLFRLFDIWKPWPVSWADQRLPGGLGVMADDLLAALLAAALGTGILSVL
jgi:phosphatidylglycerophosphatase A